MRLRNPSLLGLILLLEGVDAVLALYVGAVLFLSVSMEGVDGVGDLHPVLPPEIPPVQFQVVSPPRLNQRVSRRLRPAVLPSRENRRPRRRRRNIRGKRNQRLFVGSRRKRGRRRRVRVVVRCRSGFEFVVGHGF